MFGFYNMKLDRKIDVVMQNLCLDIGERCNTIEIGALGLSGRIPCSVTSGCLRSVED
jgi:hypothetical protein